MIFTAPATTDQLDAAYALLEGHDPTLPGGYTNHLPLVAEALDHLGRPEQIPEHVNADTVFALRALRPAWTAPPLRVANRDTAAWTAHYQRSIDHAGAEHALNTALHLNADAAATTAGHGLIHTHHAHRAYRANPNPTRTRQLAAALGHWTAHHHTLPTITPNGWRTPYQTLGEIAPTRPGNGCILEELHLNAVRAADCAARAHIDANPTDAANAIADAAISRLRAGSGVTAYIHAVTTANATCWLVQHTDPTTARRLINSTWVFIAALWATYGHATSAPPPTPHTPGELIDAAVASGDIHRIKLAAATVDLADRIGAHIWDYTAPVLTAPLGGAVDAATV